MNHVCCCGARNLYLNMAMNTINWFQLPKQSAIQKNISTSFGPPNHGCRGYTTSKYIKLKIIILWLYQLLLKFGFFFQKLSLLFGDILLLEYCKLSPPSSASPSSSGKIPWHWPLQVLRGEMNCTMCISSERYSRWKLFKYSNLYISWFEKM